MQRRKYIISLETLQDWILKTGIAILLLNFIFYSFFQVSYSKNAARIISMILLFICFLSQRERNKTELLMICGCIYMILIDGESSINIAVLLLLCLVIPYNANSLLKQLSFFQFVILAIVVVSLLSGFRHSTRDIVGLRVRNTLGFVNANNASELYFSIIIVWLYTKEKITKYNIVFSIVSFYFLYKLTDSRAAFICAIFFIVGEMFTRRFHNNVVAKVICIIEGGLFLLPALIILLYNIFPQLDMILSFRLRIFSRYITNNNILTQIFGGTDIPNIDNFYLCLLYNGGLPFYVFTMVITIKSTWQYIIYEHDHKSPILIVAVLLFGTMESGLISCEILYPIIFWHLISKPLKSKRIDAEQQERIDAEQQEQTDNIQQYRIGMINNFNE